MSPSQRHVLTHSINLLCADAGYPHLGESAIDPMIDVLHDLKHETWQRSEELGNTTLNIGLISGGIASNAVPDSASAMLMFRLTVEPEAVLSRVKVSLSARELLLSSAVWLTGVSLSRNSLRAASTSSCTPQTRQCT
jgi:acetylornithine deacetylase/succinyl-diaminopimelate desuccinylase-like protein